MTFKTTVRLTESNNKELRTLKNKIKKEKNKGISLNQLINISLKYLLSKEDQQIIKILQQYNQL